MTDDPDQGGSVNESVGYSALDTYTDCYEYNEDACYIADSPQSLRDFLAGAVLPTENYKITPVKVVNMLSDFGCSSGEYALEPKALERFEKAADSSGIIYTVKQYEDIFDIEPKLFIVNLKETNEKFSNSPKEAISKILKNFEIYDGIYRRESVDNAIQLKDNITPHLIGILNNILNNPSDYLENNDYYAHIYAFILLGHFKESRAHKTIIELFSLPDNLPHKLFGDFVTESLPVVLLRTCGNSLDGIKSLALNTAAYDYCRVSALEAMVFAVAEGITTREEVLSFFGSLFTGKEAKDCSDFWGLLANFVCDLYPEELMDTIQKAYQAELINSGMISYQDFEETLQEGKEKCLEKISEQLKENSLDDIHSYMSGLACFNQEEPTPVPTADLFTAPKKKSGNKEAKKKRKRAKASRKKNRR